MSVYGGKEPPEFADSSPIRDAIERTPERDLQEIVAFGRFLRIGNQVAAAVLFPTDAHANIMKGEYWQNYMSHVEAGLEQIRNMPDMTVDDRITRVAALIRHNAEYPPHIT